MKILADFHHSGLARGLTVLFAKRLGHEIYFPDMLDGQDIKWGISTDAGTWGVMHREFWDSVGRYPDQDSWERHGIITYDEFMDTRFDLILITFQQSQPIIRNLLKKYRYSPKMACQAGNDGYMDYDYTVYKNLLSSTWTNHKFVPREVNHIWYCQELGFQYHGEYQPITDESLRTINSFMTHLHAGYNQDFQWHHDSYVTGRCPHCFGQDEAEELVNVYQEWEKARQLLKDFEFVSYGNSDKFPGGRPFVSETELPAAYCSGSLTWHPKPHEGYGMSMLQSIAMGRPVLVPERFYKYKTANRFLIPDITCFEVGGTAESVVECIKAIVTDVDTMNRYGIQCHKVAQSLFDWDYEAWKVDKWLERLI